MPLRVEPQLIRELLERIERLEKNSIKDLIATNGKVAYGSDHVTWVEKKAESPSKEIILPSELQEPGAIFLTAFVSPTILFHILEAKPYAGKFNVRGRVPAGEAPAGTEGFFYWLAIK